jgi:DNA-binding MarR family transcriptional regulator
MKIDPTTFKKILISLTMTQDEEIDCEECYNHMDRFAEMLLDGEDPEKVMPLVKHHLELCGDCHEEFEALSIALAACEEHED